MLSCEICKIFKNTYFEEYLQTTASVVSFSWLHVHYLRHRFITQTQNAKRGVNIFTIIKNKTVDNRKNNFQLIHFRKSSMFRRCIPLNYTLVADLIVYSQYESKFERIGVDGSGWEHGLVQPKYRLVDSH